MIMNFEPVLNEKKQQNSMHKRLILNENQSEQSFLEFLLKERASNAIFFDDLRLFFGKKILSQRREKEKMKLAFRDRCLKNKFSQMSRLGKIIKKNNVRDRLKSLQIKFKD